MMFDHLQPLDVVHLFPEMRAELLRILRDLPDEEWQLPTACEGWSVKDVALHILADDIGYLSRHRDNDGITFVTESFEELVELINQHNDTWVRATRRMSKRLLLSFLQTTGDELHTYLQSIDPSTGSYAVAWAGTQDSPMWLQIARELTEYWMHHQHIAEALNITSLKNRRFLHPVLSIFVMALPRTYQAVDAPDGTVVELHVTGEAEDSWFIQRGSGFWILHNQLDTQPDSTVTLPDDTAWRLFTKGITPEEAEAHATITGDIALGKVLFNTVSIIA